MKSSRFSETQRRAIVDSQKSKTVELICQEHQISPGTFYKWKESFSIQNNEDKKRLRELEKENEQLKKMYAELELEKRVISDALEIAKKLVAQKKKTNF